ncbi:unnamed protein product, partial [Didymodactylos carnosus]
MKLYYYSSPSNIHIIRNSEKLCDSQTDILALVIIKASNILYRDLLRRTWSHSRTYQNFTLKTLFVIGTSMTITNETLKWEYQNFQDIIQFDIPDHLDYLQLYKEIVAFKWSERYCSQAKFIVKISGNVIVDPFTLITRMKEFMNTSTLKSVSSHGRELHESNKTQR